MWSINSYKMLTSKLSKSVIQKNINKEYSKIVTSAKLNKNPNNYPNLTNLHQNVFVRNSSQKGSSIFEKFNHNDFEKRNKGNKSDHSEIKENYGDVFSDHEIRNLLKEQDNEVEEDEEFWKEREPPKSLQFEEEKQQLSKTDPEITENMDIVEAQKEIDQKNSEFDKFVQLRELIHSQNEIGDEMIYKWDLMSIKDDSNPYSPRYPEKFKEMEEVIERITTPMNRKRSENIFHQYNPYENSSIPISFNQLEETWGLPKKQTYAECVSEVVIESSDAQDLSEEDELALSGEAFSSSFDEEAIQNTYIVGDENEKKRSLFDVVTGVDQKTKRVTSNNQPSKVDELVEDAETAFDERAEKGLSEAHEESDEAQFSQVDQFLRDIGIVLDDSTENELNEAEESDPEELSQVDTLLQDVGVVLDKPAETGLNEVGESVPAQLSQVDYFLQDVGVVLDKPAETGLNEVGESVPAQLSQVDYFLQDDEVVLDKRAETGLNKAGGNDQAQFSQVDQLVEDSGIVLDKPAKRELNEFEKYDQALFSQVDRLVEDSGIVLDKPAKKELNEFDKYDRAVFSQVGQLLEDSGIVPDKSAKTKLNDQTEFRPVDELLIVDMDNLSKTSSVKFDINLQSLEEAKEEENSKSKKPISFSTTFGEYLNSKLK